MDLEKDRILKETEIVAIAQAIGKNWEILGTQLGLPITTIEHIKMDYDTSVKRIQKMLLVWKQENGEDATLCNLKRAIEEAPTVSVDWERLPGISLPRKSTCQGHYIQLKQNLKSDLIQFNREQLGTTAISPVNKEIDAPLLELYVSPVISKVDNRIGKRSGHCPVKQTTTLNEMFREQTRGYQQIYISAEAGLGKTVFAKRLALIWCEANDSVSVNTAHAQEHTFSDDELCVMRDFEFVFYVSLKDVDPSDCKVDDMIQNQVIGYLARTSEYSHKFMEYILSSESCLIILDGLDEWSHPTTGNCKKMISERKSNIPHKQSRKTCTFLTTTRPWKLIFANISNTKIDQQFEIVGLDKTASEKLRNKVIEKLKAYPVEENGAHPKRDFDIEDVDHKIESIKTNPMLIMYLACLKNDSRNFGNSMCELHGNILEMMLQRADPEADIFPSIVEDIPGCFKENEYCQSYFSSLRELGHLAFQTLFNLNGESRLVFSNSLAQECMPEKHFRLWLKSGILTYTGFHKQLTRRKTQVSFVHKTFHEFFAALYMSIEKRDMFVENVLKTCRHISHILEMKSAFVFLSGFCSNQSNMILRKFAEVVADDCLVVRLRHTTYPFLDYWDMCDLLEQFQNMMVDCVNESADNHQLADCYVNDIILHSKPKERYISALKELLRHVKLLKIGRQLSTDDAHELLEELNLLHPDSLKHLEKLDMWGLPNSDDIDLLLRGSAKALKCLLLHGCKMIGNKETDAYIQFSDFTMEILQGLERLDSIDLFSIEMKHHQTEELIEWLEKRKSMTQIKLSRIKCSDHGNYLKGNLKQFIKCKDLHRAFDLSRHENLTILGLGTMAMPAVYVKASTLQECWMERNETIITFFLGSIMPSSSILHTLVVEFVEGQDVVESIVNVLPQLRHLRHLQLKGMNLQGRDLVLSQLDTFRHIRLIEITMTILTLERLIEFFKTCKNSITAELASCIIQSDKDNKTFENLKNEIEESGVFDILFNMRCSGHEDSFAFKTLV